MTLLVHLRRNARYYPGKLAISDQNVKFTWSQFEQRTRGLAASLTRLGIKKGDRVGVLMSNGYRYLEAYYALPRMGVIIVPLNTRYSPVEFAFVLNDCAAVALLVEDTYLPLYEKFGPNLESVSQVIYSGGQNRPAGMLDYEALVESDPAGYQDAEIDENDVVGLFYTGGTTGRSK